MPFSQIKGKNVDIKLWANPSEVETAALTQLIVLFLPVMRRAGRGHVINVSSVAGSLPSQGVALYSATKSFVDALTTALYRELRGSGVHVSVVKPGPVLTEFYRTAERLPLGSPVPGEKLAIKAEVVAEAILDLLRRPRRAVWVPGALSILPWVEAGFGWILDRLGPLLLRRRGLAVCQHSTNAVQLAISLAATTTQIAVEATGWPPARRTEMVLFALASFRAQSGSESFSLDLDGGFDFGASRLPSRGARRFGRLRLIREISVRRW
jgi:hypothetical protein